MQTIAISKFKATCLAVLESVRRTGQPVLVTRFGKPVAEIVPPPAAASERRLGFMQGALGSGGFSLDAFGTGWDADETVREWDELDGRPAPPEPGNGKRRRKSA